MQTLQKLYEKHKVGDWPDKGSVHSYIDVYENILYEYAHDDRNNILEVGLMSGESLRMWAEYFAGTVYGIDCGIKPIDGKADLTQAIKDGLNIFIGDASNSEEIKKCFDGIKFDVVIEDANHDIEQQLKIYVALRPHLNEGSIYIIEDVQDIDRTRELFEKLDPEKSVEILDRRGIKNRYDDILVIIRDR